MNVLVACEESQRPDEFTNMLYSFETKAVRI